MTPTNAPMPKPINGYLLEVAIVAQIDPISVPTPMVMLENVWRSI